MRNATIERDHAHETRIRRSASRSTAAGAICGENRHRLSRPYDRAIVAPLADRHRASAVDGDLHIDQHHTVEDSALALGEAVSQALGDRRGIVRYGHAYAPMDETLSRAALDISGRPHFVWKSGFTQPRLGEMDTELFSHWFASFAQTAGITLHLETLYGENNHHIAESLFKALARALRAAVAIDPRVADAVPSTKGILGKGTLA